MVRVWGEYGASMGCLRDTRGRRSDFMDFYNLERILKYQCQYNLIIGERSNGKTYACLDYVLDRFINFGEQAAYVRRYREDFRGKRGDSLFNNHVSNGRVSELTDGEFDSVRHQSGRWYLGTYNDTINKVITIDDPFCYGFALSEVEHDKSTAYPNIKTIIFDEFLTRQYYLPNEFVIFMNCLSTIIRHRDDVTIFMLGNTVNKYCPYFKEMGLGHVGEMEQGKIDVYSYGKSKLKVAVERCKAPEKGTKKSDVYFAFDNPELQMITGGAWEIALYPHCPMDYKKDDVLLYYFIEFNENLLQCEIIQVDDVTFTFIHTKSTPIHDEDSDIVYSLRYDPRQNWFRNILHPQTNFGKVILSYFKNERVFYQDNEVGEIVRNYLNCCHTEYMKTR